MSVGEILAPLGGIDDLPAALGSGADAVYLGLKDFSARKNADNFSFEELKTVCTECHRRGVLVYCALNTLIYDSEIPHFSECVKAAAGCGADGLIIQDLGAAEIVRQICPGIPIHASTQMTLNSPAGVKAAKMLGFSRVVIGRELSLPEIEKIADTAKAEGTELEIFVHGALCVCISGQCYMSSIFGGRSGSRGLCAQPCRLDFSCGERHNILSLKDISIIPHLKELMRLGISSFKIEGRMKRPEYIACAVDACVKARNGEAYDKERLSGIFSRGGLTDAYYTGKMNNMQGIRSREDVDNSAKALNGIKAIYKSEYPRLPMDIHVEVTNSGVKATASCNGCTAEVTGKAPEKAETSPITEEKIRSRMSKLGGTQFYPRKITAITQEGLNLSAADLNSLRRNSATELDKAVLIKNTPHYTINELEYNLKSRESGETKYRCEVYTAEQLNMAMKLPFEYIYAPMRLLSETTPQKERIIVIPPFVLQDCEDNARARLKFLKNSGFSGAMAHTAAHAALLSEEGFEIHGGSRMNIINSFSAGVCGKLGFKDIILSFEGTAAQLSEIKSPIPKGIIAYGRLPLMITRRCPINDGRPCGKVKLFSDEGSPCGRCISDRKGNKMPILCGGNSVEILNPDKLIMSDRAEALSGFDFLLLKFTDEKDLKSVFDMYLSGKKPDGQLTRGLYFRGAE